MLRSDLKLGVFGMVLLGSATTAFAQGIPAVDYGEGWECRLTGICGQSAPPCDAHKEGNYCPWCPTGGNWECYNNHMSGYFCYSYGSGVCTYIKNAYCTNTAPLGHAPAWSCVGPNGSTFCWGVACENY